MISALERLQIVLDKGAHGLSVEHVRPRAELVQRPPDMLVERLDLAGQHIRDRSAILDVCTRDLPSRGEGSQRGVDPCRQPASGVLGRCRTRVP